ncbi:MAG: MBL fold metallo-hydrolase [Bdellovibrionales bacterium]|nr:MBL fold metallo-hydrolase [Bdellovibrionales bacterium]
MHTSIKAQFAPELNDAANAERRWRLICSLPGAGEGRQYGMHRLLAAFWLLVALVGCRLYGRYADSRLLITFMDVGQGDATLIRLPGGQSFLIDAGLRTRRLDMGKRVVVPVLAGEGVLKLEAAILTHPDADHVGGLVEVLSSLKVGALWLPRYFLPAHKPLLTETIARARERGVSVLPWVAPTRFTLAPGVRWWVGVGSGGSDNDRSLLVRVAFGPCAALFTGDIGADSERVLAHLGDSTVLKVSHHGSRFSSDAVFLQHMRPQIAVISSGTHNRYGHPHSDALERLRRAGSEVLRTDFHGRVDIAFDREGRFYCQSALGSCGSGYCSDSRPN